MARIACGSFRSIATAADYVGKDNRQWNAEIIADALAMCSPRIGIRVQAVMDVDGAQYWGHLFAGGCEHVQQCSGIQATAEADQHRTGAGLFED